MEGTSGMFSRNIRRSDGLVFGLGGGGGRGVKVKSRPPAVLPTFQV
jgi:hypothetical protein